MDRSLHVCLCYRGTGHFNNVNSQGARVKNGGILRERVAVSSSGTCIHDGIAAEISYRDRHACAGSQVGRNGTYEEIPVYLFRDRIDSDLSGAAGTLRLRTAITGMDVEYR